MAMRLHKYDIPALLNSSVVSIRAKEALKVLEKEMTMGKTADALGIKKRSLQKLLSNANKKYMREQVDDLIPDGLSLKGTTDHYKINEDTGKYEKDHFYIKTDKDKESQLAMIRTVTEEIAKQVEGKAKIIKEPKLTNEDLLVVYVSTDLHLGQYSWHEETGNDVNINTIYNNTINAVRLLKETTPNSKECIVLDLGDTLHASNDSARTKSGHELDVDSRHAKVFKTLIDMKIKMIDLALAKHSKVKYVVVAGNHSDLVPNYLIAMLSAYYRNEKRFSVDDSSSLHKYHRHGNTLLGFHHGHATKMGKLPEVMVWDRKEDISDTTYRYWLTGHVHSDKVLDGGIARCEAFRNNTNNDAWSAGSGYRVNKQTTAITYHKDFGEVARNIVPIKMLEDVK